MTSRHGRRSAAQCELGGLQPDWWSYSFRELCGHQSWSVGCGELRLQGAQQMKAAFRIWHPSWLAMPRQLLSCWRTRLPSQMSWIPKTLFDLVSMGGTRQALTFVSLEDMVPVHCRMGRSTVWLMV